MRNFVLIVTLLFIIASTAFGKTSSTLPFIADNFDKALIAAKQRDVPLFVDVWAPW